jgi:hypothetical protein
LHEIKDYIQSTCELSENQLGVLEARLSYLEGGIDRLGRVDCRSAALGTVFTLVAEAVQPQHALHRVLVMLLQPLGHLFGHPMLGLPPG